MNTRTKTGLIALAVSTFLAVPAMAAHDRTAPAAGFNDTPLHLVQIGDLDLPVSPPALSQAERIVVAGSNTLRRKRLRKPQINAIRMHKPRRPGKFAPNSSGHTNAPAEINCDIESSEECEKIVIAEPNCSTEHMQGGDYCE